MGAQRDAAGASQPQGGTFWTSGSVSNRVARSLSPSGGARACKYSCGKGEAWGGGGRETRGGRGGELEQDPGQLPGLYLERGCTLYPRRAERLCSEGQNSQYP